MLNFTLPIQLYSKRQFNSTNFPSAGQRLMCILEFVDYWFRRLAVGVVPFDVCVPRPPRGNLRLNSSVLSLTIQSKILREVWGRWKFNPETKIRIRHVNYHHIKDGSKENVEYILQLLQLYTYNFSISSYNFSISSSMMGLYITLDSMPYVHASITTILPFYRFKIIAVDVLKTHETRRRQSIESLVRAVGLEEAPWGLQHRVVLR